MHHSRSRQIPFLTLRCRLSPAFSRWATWLALTAAILAFMPMTGRAMAPLAATDAAAPSPANRTNAVIAQGVAAPPAASVAWRIVHDTADPTGVAEYQDRALGFVYADTDPILLTDADGTQVRLAAGEGAFVPDDISQLRQSLTGDPTSYVRIALVPAEAATDGGGGTLIYAGNPFDAPGGPSDLDLVYGTATTSALDEVGVTGHAPLIVYAIDGDLEVTLHEGTKIPVSAGEASVFPSPILIRSAGPDGSDAAYLAATLGAEVSPPSPTASVDQSPSISLPDPAGSSPTIDINLAVCPSDFVYPTGGQGTVRCDNAAPIPGATVALTADSDGTTVTGETDEAGNVHFADMVTTTYFIDVDAPFDEVALDDGVGNTITWFGACGATAVDGSPLGLVGGFTGFTVGAEMGSIECLFQTINPESQTENGSDQADPDPAGSDDTTGNVSVEFVVEVCPPNFILQATDLNQDGLSCEDGAPISGANVFVYDATDPSLTPVFGITDDSGIAVIEGLPFGSFTYEVDAPFAEVVANEGTPDAYSWFGSCGAFAPDGTVLGQAGDASTFYVGPDAASIKCVIQTFNPEWVLEYGPDSDGDGLPDAIESGFWGTDPADPDTDGDGYSDGDETSQGTNPLDPQNTPPSLAL